MSKDLQREVLFFQSLSHDEKLQLLTNAGLIQNDTPTNVDSLNEIIANNIELLKGEPITPENTDQTNTGKNEEPENVQDTTASTIQKLHSEAFAAILNEPPIQTPALKQDKARKAGERLTLTVSFSGESADYVHAVIEAHKEAGLCTNNSDFSIKAFDFAINLGFFTGKQLFGVPENHQYKLLKNGFADFLKANPKITVCK